MVNYPTKFLLHICYYNTGRHVCDEQLVVIEIVWIQFYIAVLRNKSVILKTFNVFNYQVYVAISRLCSCACLAVNVIKTRRTVVNTVQCSFLLSMNASFFLILSLV